MCLVNSCKIYVSFLILDDTILTVCFSSVKNVTLLWFDLKGFSRLQTTYSFLFETKYSLKIPNFAALK